MQPEMTAHEIANEIGVRQIQSRIYGEGETFVMVEGKTDQVLWEEYRAREDCTLLPAQGKDKIIAALEVTRKRKMRGVAGIVDADYWLITEADELGTENLLYDDCCPDLETLLLSSPALKKVLRNNLYNYDVDEIHEFAEDLTCVAKRLAAEFGYFRLLNHVKDYGIRFRDFDFSEVIDVDTLQLDSVETAKRLASTTADITGEDLLREVDELRERHPANRLQLCRGKDVVAILAILLPLRFKAKFGEDLPTSAAAALADRALSIHLRSAYDTTYFTETSLYGCIRNWECANIPYKILRPQL